MPTLPESNSPPPAERGTPAPTAATTAPEEGAIAVLGRIPSGLFVVTWREGDADRTMLASWVMQAGFAPPLISIAVAKGRDLLAAIDRGTSLVVNILGESQRPLLARFGRPPAAGEDPLAGLSVVRTADGTAALAGTTGWLSCRGIARTHSGDHAVVVAEVIAGGMGSGEQPLVHVRRNGLRY